MSTLDNAIEIIYRKFGQGISSEYEALYSSIPHQRLKAVFSTLHANLTALFEKMNTRLPTNDEEAYFWAEDSRELLWNLEIIRQLQKALINTSLAFDVDPYYNSLFLLCNSFLQQYRGSTIPAHTDKIELYYTIPIFTLCNTAIEVDAPQVRRVDRNYIASIYQRAQEDIEHENYDSAITKCRTLLEETFCYVIELKGEEPSNSGNIRTLYNQVKQLYHMHQDRDVDRRINSLLSGLEKIVAAMAEMRNEGSDAHGVGHRRFTIAEYHARLLLNSAITMADFILSVGENQST